MKKLLLLLITVFCTLPSIAQETLTPNNATRWYAEYKNYFEDEICTQLKPAYQVMADEQLRTAMSNFPEELIGFALKVKNNTWDSFEKDFRVQKFKPYSNSYKWAKYMNVYQYSDLQSPTGIIGSNEYIYVFVGGEVPSNAFLYIDVVADNGSYALTEHMLREGLNVFKLADTEEERRMLFLEYKVETDTTATSKKLSDYPELSLHIEGGHVYGYFNAERHDNAFWKEMLKRQANDPIAASYKGIQAKGEKVIFHMFRSSLANGCPEKITEALELWDETIKRQHQLMGAEQYYDRWNDLIMARSDNKGGGFYASPTFTYYDDYALSGMLSPEYIHSNPGTLWTSAHEIGHVNQGAINMVGCTEASNNLFANMNIHQLGISTTRGDGVAFCAEEFNKKTPFPARTSNPIGVARMYFQLYLYFHIAEKDTTFYPRLFEALRKNPLTKGYITYGKDDQLKFAETCCEIAQMDLSEFFEAWGFFEPMESLNIGDYGTYLVTLTKEEIEASRVRMQKYPKKGGHLMFIEDRVKPSKRTDGVSGNRIDFNEDYAIGKMGDIGQWSDYIDESVKAVGYYYTNANGTIEIKRADNAKGALGFKVYIADTNELLSFSNKYSVKLPTYAKYYNLKVYAAQADGNDVEVTSAAQSDNETWQKEALEAQLQSVNNILQRTTEDGKQIGRFYKNAIKDLSDLYQRAKTACDNGDTSEHTFSKWSAMLDEEFNKLMNNPYARAILEELDVYKILNVKYKCYMCNDKYGMQALKQTSKLEDTNWMYWSVEHAGEDGEFYIKDKNGKYINGVETNGASCNGNSKEDAIVFKIKFLENGNAYFVAKESGLVLTSEDNNNTAMIYGAKNVTDLSLWNITVVEKNNTAVEDIEVEDEDCTVIYDLLGRRIENPGKGIYIKNGKKIMINQ